MDLPLQALKGEEGNPFPPEPENRMIDFTPVNFCYLNTQDEEGGFWWTFNAYFTAGMEEAAELRRSI